MAGEGSSPLSHMLATVGVKKSVRPNLSVLSSYLST